MLHKEIFKHVYIEALHGLYWFCLFQLSIAEICWDCWFQSIFLECVIFFQEITSNSCNNCVLSTITEYCYGLTVYLVQKHFYNMKNKRLCSNRNMRKSARTSGSNGFNILYNYHVANYTFSAHWFGDMVCLQLAEGGGIDWRRRRVEKMEKEENREMAEEEMEVKERGRRSSWRRWRRKRRWRRRVRRRRWRRRMKRRWKRRGTFSRCTRPSGAFRRGAAHGKCPPCPRRGCNNQIERNEDISIPTHYSL